jgi:hypothetical protein
VCLRCVEDGDAVYLFGYNSWSLRGEFNIVTKLLKNR